jgi:hypothetical protein
MEGDHLQEITMTTGAEKVSEDFYRVWSCDYRFSLGEKYLVYARLTSDGKAVARYCTRTTKLTDGKTDIPQLDTLNPCAYQAPTSDSSSSCWIDRVEELSLTVGLLPTRCARGRRLSQLVLQFSAQQPLLWPRVGNWQHQ